MRSWRTRPWSAQYYPWQLHQHDLLPTLVERLQLNALVRYRAAPLLRRNFTLSSTSPFPLTRVDQALIDPPLCCSNSSSGHTRNATETDEKKDITPLLTKSISGPSSWVDKLEPFLPKHLRAKSVEETNRPIASVTSILAQADSQENIDLLSHLALVGGRWDAFVWFAFHIVEDSTAPSISWRSPRPYSSIEWPQHQTLDYLTGNPLGKDEISSAAHEVLRPYRLAEAENDTRRLNDLLDPFLHSKLLNSATKARNTIGQLWISLGKMVIAAADRDAEQSSDIMSRVAAILCKLHSKRLLPRDVFEEPRNQDDLALQQPPFVPNLSRTLLLAPSMMSGSSLTSVQGIDQFAKAWKPKTETSAPGQWLEYILWCCVHGGWLMEGASIVDEMGKAPGSKLWRLSYWRNYEISTASSVKKLERLSSLGQMEIETHRPSPMTCVVSAEVVVALADGLVSTVLGSAPGIGYPPIQVVQRLHSLRRCLDRDKLALGNSTWVALIARLADSPLAHETNSSPQWFESVLGLAKTYAFESVARNDTRAKSMVLDKATPTATPSHNLDGSAAVLGLYHRTLHAHIQARDIDGALRVLAALQRLTDRNKQESLREFFAELKSTDVKEGAERQYEATSVGKAFPGVDYPGFFPNLPLDVLAGLLDLLNDCDATDLSRWLIYSSDIDGPLIPEQAHGNQTIAPALIRFAAKTSDTALLRRLMRAQTTAISGHTLVALCESRIGQGDFRGASEIFGLIRDYALHEWKANNFGLVLRSLLLQIYGRGQSRGLDHPHSQQASELCQKLLRGDLGQVWGTSFAQLDTIVQILSSLDEHMAQLCSNLLPRSQQYAVNLPSNSFNYILDGAIKVWGSGKGRSMWDQWCKDVTDRTLAGSSGRPLSIAEQFSAATSVASTNSEDTGKGSEYIGRVKPTMVTLRIILQQASEERRQSNPQQARDGDAQGASSVASFDDTLSWARRLLRDDFRLTEADIDYELSGLIASQEQDWEGDSDDAVDAVDAISIDKS